MLLRGVGDSIDDRLAAILGALPLVEGALADGAVVVTETDRVRLRVLPVDDDA